MVNREAEKMAALLREAQIARAREPLAVREAVHHLTDRLESPIGNANVLLETIQGLVELNLALVELLIHNKAVPEEEVIAALTEASDKFEDGMGAFILGSALNYLRDGDGRMVRLAKIVRAVRGGGGDRPRSPSGG